MSTFVLKLLVMAAMLADHTGLMLLHCNSVGARLYMLMRAVGRLAMPVFCYFIVVGHKNSRDRKKYLHRLCLFALISQMPYSLAFNHAAYYAPCSGGLLLAWTDFTWIQWLLFAAVFLGLLIFFGKKALMPCAALIVLFVRISVGRIELPGGNGNVFYDLALGLAVIWFIDTLKNSKVEIGKLLPAGFILICAVLLIAPVGDYGWKALALIVPLFLCGENRWAMLGCLGLWCVAVYGNVPATCMGALCSAVLLAFYNGKKGPRLKYMFYAFYPAHLALLWFLGRFIIIKS